MNQPTTRRFYSRWSHHTRLALPISWATVRMGMASHTPNLMTSIRRMAASPNPVTAVVAVHRSGVTSVQVHWLSSNTFPARRG